MALFEKLTENNTKKISYECVLKYTYYIELFWSKAISEKSISFQQSKNIPRAKHQVASPTGPSENIIGSRQYRRSCRYKKC